MDESIPLYNVVWAQDWDHLRRRLQRDLSPDTIGVLVSLSWRTACRTYPDDIFESLLAKGRDNGFGELFSPLDCRRRGLINKIVSTICRTQSVASIRRFAELLLEQYEARNIKKYAPIFDCDDSTYTRTLRDATNCLWEATNIRLDGWDHVACLDELRLSNDQNIMKFVTLWGKTQVLLNAIEGAKEESTPLIHLMIELGLPKFTVWVALRLCPELASEKDNRGRLALHVAAELSNKRKYGGDVQYLFYTLRNEEPRIQSLHDSTILEVVFDAFPEGAAQKDNEGLLPLDILLHTVHTDDKYHDWTSRCVLKLVDQYPESLTRKNPQVRHMLPFMIAANMETNNITEKNLDLTYDLLSRNPSVIFLGIKPSSREIHLERRLKVAETRIEALEAENRNVINENMKLKKELALLQDTKATRTMPPNEEPLSKRARLEE